MTRSEYLKELDEHLIALSKEERDMAVSFYSEYFDEAGPENEQAVINELGKPYNLAKSIISENSAFSKSQVYMDYKESKPMPQNGASVFASLQKPDAFQGAGAVPFDDSEDVLTPKAAAENAARAESAAKAAAEQDIMPNEHQKANTGMFDDFYRNGGNAGDDEKSEQQTAPPPPQPGKKKLDTGMIVLIVILAVFIGIPVVCTVIPVIFAVIVAMMAFGVAAAACFIAAAIAFILGIIKMFSSVPMGLGFIFASLLCAGIGLMLMSLTVLFFGKLMPWTVKSIAKLFRKRRGV